MKIFCAALSAVVLLHIGTAAAQTPTYPPPATDSRCAQVGTQSDGDFRQTTVFPVRGLVAVAGARGCALAGELVRMFVESQRLLVADGIARQDGSYALEGNLPPQIRPGAHQIVVVLGEDRMEFVQPITVEGPIEAGLPVTGADIAMLAIWGFALTGLGTFSVVAAWKRFRRPPAIPSEPPRGIRPEHYVTPHIDTCSVASRRGRPDDTSE